MFPGDNLRGGGFDNLDRSGSGGHGEAAVRYFSHIYGLCVVCSLSLGDGRAGSESCDSSVDLLHGVLSGRECACLAVVVLDHR